MQPAAERVYELVKERIIDGTIDSSQMLSEAALAAEVGVSRTPAHEAFLRLELEGFLQLYPKRGALVVPISPKKSGRSTRRACLSMPTVPKRSASWARKNVGASPSAC